MAGQSQPRRNTAAGGLSERPARHPQIFPLRASFPSSLRAHLREPIVVRACCRRLIECEPAQGEKMAAWPHPDPCALMVPAKAAAPLDPAIGVHEHLDGLRVHGTGENEPTRW